MAEGLTFYDLSGEVKTIDITQKQFSFEPYKLPLKTSFASVNLLDPQNFIVDAAIYPKPGKQLKEADFAPLKEFYKNTDPQKGVSAFSPIYQKLDGTSNHGHGYALDMPFTTKEIVLDDLFEAAISEYITLAPTAASAAEKQEMLNRLDFIKKIVGLGTDKDVKIDLEERTLSVVENDGAPIPARDTTQTLAQRVRDFVGLGKNIVKSRAPPSWTMIRYNEDVYDEIKAITHAGDKENAYQTAFVNPWTRACLNQGSRGMCVGFAFAEFIRMGHPVYEDVRQSVRYGDYTGKLASNIYVNDNGNPLGAEYLSVEYLFNRIKRAEYEFNYNINFWEALVNMTKRESWEASNKWSASTWLVHTFQYKDNRIAGTYGNDPLPQGDESNSDQFKTKVSTQLRMANVGNQNNVTGYFANDGVVYPVNNTCDIPIPGVASQNIARQYRDERETNDATTTPNVNRVTRFGPPNQLMPQNITNVHGSRLIGWTKSTGLTDNGITALKEDLMKGPIMIAIRTRDYTGGTQVQVAASADPDNCNGLNWFAIGNSRIWDNAGVLRNGNGHAIVLCGFCDNLEIIDADGNKYSEGCFIKNSWGNWGGKSGFGVITYRCVKADYREKVFYANHYDNDGKNYRPDIFELKQAKFVEVIKSVFEKSSEESTN